MSEWDKTQQQLLTTSSQTISLAEEQRPLNGGRRRKQVATEWAGRWKGSEEPHHGDWLPIPLWPSRANGETVECAMADHGSRLKRVSQIFVKTQPGIFVERLWKAEHSNVWHVYGVKDPGKVQMYFATEGQTDDKWQLSRLSERRN